MQYSKNKRAEDVVGKRSVDKGAIIFGFPLELGYQCPVCKKCKDESLEWSEYNGFIWCRTCNKDYPSCLCQPDIDKAIDIYLSCVAEQKDGIYE